MPSSDPPFIYWDTNVLLALLNAEEGRVEHVRAFMQDADNGKIRIVTSMLTVTEVAFAAHEKAAGALDAETDQAIRALWLPSSPIKLVEYHFMLAERSRGLIREAVSRGWKLKPADSIHLATAENMGVSELHTYDAKDFAQWSAVIKTPIAEPISDHPQML